MRRFVVTSFVFWSAVANAQTGVGFDFNAVPIGVFAQATFKNLMHRDYVMSPDLQGGERKITVSVASVDKKDVPAFVESVLQQQGVSAIEHDGVYYLSLAKPALDDSAHADGALGVGGAVVGGKVAAYAGVVEHVQDRRAADLESFVFEPQNRPADFLVAVLDGAFAAKSAVIAGGNIVLSGTKGDLAKMKALLTAIDSVPKLVDVSASWIEVTNSSTAGRGISLVARVLGERLGAQLGSVSSGSAISFGNTNFQLVIDALNTDSRFKQVSNSRVVGDDYEKLLLTVGDETPTVGSTGKDNAGNAVQNIVYRPSGVIVDVTPKVLGNGRIRLVVDGQISNFKATDTGVAGSPTLIKRQVKTSVTVADGEVLLIGGLNDVQNTDNTSRWSFLPASWAARSNTSTASDLVLVLSAKVASALPKAD